jgi:hypothetical protein
LCERASEKKSIASAWLFFLRMPAVSIATKV